MNITIGKPWAVTEKGGRLNNEDSIFPQPETETKTLKMFLVCDGVGGAEKGEIASALACESIKTYFDTFLVGNPDVVFINKAIRYTESRFDEYVLHHPEAHGMATTLAMIFIGTNGVTLAHIGDSRIYHIRDNKILHETDDHSLVNQWVKMGKITRDQAAVHPQKNIILRAIEGTEHPTEAEVKLITDIEAGDNFFLCTDGVLENLRDNDILSIISQSKDGEEIKDDIMAACLGKTRDNFSFYIVPIQNVIQTIGLKQNILSFLYSFI